MAIKIPSSKIYEMQNPKVRDNVIERIEVGAKEVVPSNTVDEVVYSSIYNLSPQSSDIIKTFSDSDIGFQKNFGDIYAIGYANIKTNTAKYTKGVIKVPKNPTNKYVSSIVKKDNQNFNYILKGSITKKSIISTLYVNSETDYYYSSLSYYDEKESEGEIKFPKMPLKVDGGYGGAKVESNITDETNVNISIEEDNDYYYLSYSILYYYLFETLKGYNYDLKFSFPYDIPLYGDYEKYIATKIEITVYGNTIGIDLIDNTVYVPNEKESKKVHSIDGNELMQTQNYLLYEGDELSQGTDFVWYFGLDQNGVERQEVADINIKNKSLYGKTIKIVISDRGGDTTYYREAVSNSIIIDNGYYIEGIKIYLSTVIPLINWQYETLKSKYANGKETATIRCSISDYYDYDDQAKKVIAIDNSTAKMAFEEYDQVIPMVYGADGVDRPMSLKLDGSPKVFTVLGTKIFHDGAIFQEISLQEA